MGCGRKGFDSVMMKLLLTGIFLTELVKYGVWFKGIYGLSFSRRRWGSAVAGIYIFLIGAEVVNQNTLILLWTFTVLLIYGIMIECNIGERGVNVIQAFLINICLSEIMSTFIRVVFGIGWWQSKTELKIYYLVGNVLVIIILLIIFGLRKNIKFKYDKKKYNLWQVVMYAGILVMGTVIFLTVNGFQNMARYVEDNEIGKFSLFVSFVSFICLACLVMIITYMFSENKRYKLYMEKDMLLLDTQRNMYEIMLAKNTETKKFRHDIHNHLLCLTELVDNGNLEKVKDYIIGIEGNLYSNYNKVYLVGNSVIDVVLNYYISMLEKEVRINVEGNCPKDIKMNDVDLCIVISNLVQNAEEALNKNFMEDKFLEIKFQSIKGYLNIQIRNSVPSNLLDFDYMTKMPKTTKENKPEHGIGVKNVKDTVEKNGGLFEMKVNSEEFAVNVMIPLLDE